MMELMTWFDDLLKNDTSHQQGRNRLWDDFSLMQKESHVFYGTQTPTNMRISCFLGDIN